VRSPRRVAFGKLQFPQESAIFVRQRRDKSHAGNSASTLGRDNTSHRRTRCGRGTGGSDLRHRASAKRTRFAHSSPHPSPARRSARTLELPPSLLLLPLLLPLLLLLLLRPRSPPSLLP